MEIRHNKLDNYIEKINLFLKYLKYKNWSTNGSERDVESVLNSAIQIEKVLLRDEAKTVRNALAVIYPQYNFERCADLVLERLLHTESNEKVVIHAMNMYVQAYSKEQLCKLIHSLLHTQRMKDQLLSLIFRIKNENVVKILNAKTVLYLWEELVIENVKEFESSVKEMCKGHTSLLLDCLQMSSKKTGQLILKVVLSLLDSQSDFHLWFTLLNSSNIKETSVLCSLYPEFMDALLKFFQKYAAKAECKDDLFWEYQNYPLNTFIDILQFLLVKDDKISVTVNDFITNEINNFDKHFLFWVNVKVELLRF